MTAREDVDPRAVVLTAEGVYTRQDCNKMSGHSSDLDNESSETELEGL